MNFRRWVVFTFLIHVLVIGIDKGGGLILYLLTANQPKEHGQAGIVASLPFVLGAVANLGLATAMVYFVRRKRFSAQVCFETSLTVALVWGTAVAVVAALVTLFALPAIDADWTFDPTLVLPFCAVVPLLLVASYANSTQLATDRVRDYGVVHLVTSLSFLPAFFALFLWFGGRVEDVKHGVAWGRLVSTAFVALFALWLVRRVVRIRLRVDRTFLREGVRYGWKANLTSTLTYLNHRVDLLVLAAVYFAHLQATGTDGITAERLASEQVAFYSMAVTWAELVWHFPEAMRDLFFSKVAGSTHEQARALTPVLARIGLAVSLVGAAAMLVLIDPIMGAITALAKGEATVWFRDWSPSVSAALLALVPGTVAFTVSKVLQADLAARNRLQTCVNAQFMVLGVMLALDFALIPAHGATGAALASTIAYVVSTCYTVWAYVRETGTPAWRCLVVARRDLQYVRDIVRAVWHQVRRLRS